MNMTIDSLKEIAAGVVAGMNNSGTSLNDGIIKAASERQLNPEQIKRVVEATNQIAYLHKVATTQDRTDEFPLADYNSIIDAFVNVEAPQMEKEASARGPVRANPLDLIAEPAMEKSASEQPTEYVPSRAERMVALQKGYQRGMTKLASMYEAEVAIADNLRAEAARTKARLMDRDGEEVALMKVAQVSGSDFTQMCNLVFGHVKEAGTHFREFETNEVSEVKSLHDLYGLAKQAHHDRKELESQLEKAAAYLSKHAWGLEKSAFVAPTLGRIATGAKNILKSKTPKLSSGASKVGKRTMKVGTVGMAGAEIAEISQKTKPKHDVWKSLHG